MTDVHPLIVVSRSAMEERQKCPRARYFAYHAPLVNGGNEQGISLIGGKYEARLGQILHTALAKVLLEGKLTDAIMKEAETMLQVEMAACFPDMPNDSHFKKEQTSLLLSLIGHWCHYRLAELLREYEVVSVEVEQKVVFNPADWMPADIAQTMLPINFPFRADAILKHRASGDYYIFDFKTASQASEDWNINLDNSLQSYLYIAAAEQHLGVYISGIIYAGLVKGKRQEDKAFSSPFKGQVINYGHYLYGWSKEGQVYKDYVKGRNRHFLGYQTPQYLEGLGFNLKSFFPITMPWRPIGIQHVVAQQIVAENRYHQDLEAIRKQGDGTIEGREAALVIMEQKQSSCFKYGTKHPCQFVKICHEGLHYAELPNYYERREDHHGANNEA